MSESIAWFERREIQSRNLNWKKLLVREWKCSRNMNSPSVYQYRTFTRIFKSNSQMQVFRSHYRALAGTLFLAFLLDHTSWKFRVWWMAWFFVHPRNVFRKTFFLHILRCILPLSLDSLQDLQFIKRKNANDHLQLCLCGTLRNSIFVYDAF